MPDVVIVGVDGSDAGAHAVEFAAARAREAGAHLVVAHVIHWSPFSIQTPEENERRHADREKEIRLARQTIVDPLLDSLRGEGVDVEGVIRHGHPAETLCDLANEHGADHIVVGRRGRSRVRSMLFGSTAGTLIQVATVPVTVVP